jgi:hypothetical protein
VEEASFTDLRDIVRELAQAQVRTEARVGELTQAQARTETRLEALTARVDTLAVRTVAGDCRAVRGGTAAWPDPLAGC